MQSSSKETSAAPVRPYPSSALAWFIVGVLFLLYWLSMVDRLVISLLVEPIRQDLGISDFEISLLQGIAFGIFYALCGLPLGWLVDRFSRRWIIFCGVSVWTLATVACGMARNFGQLFLARIGVGAGEAALSPAAYSILADTFPPHRLTTALTVFSFGSMVGTSMAFLFGGLVVDFIGSREAFVLPLLGEVRSWQMVFVAIGAPGLLFALLAFAFPEPIRRHVPSSSAATRAPRDGWARLWGFLRSRRGFFLCHHLGFTLFIAATTGLMVWYPAHMSRSFGWSPSEIGISLGVTLTVFGLIGVIVNGQAVDRWFARGRTDAHLRWFSGCVLVAVPIGLAGVLADNAWVFLGAIGVLQIFTGSVMGIAAAALQLVSPSDLRGRLSAIYLFVNIFFGIALGPSIVGAFTDFLFRDDGKLGYSLALLIAVLFPLSALVLRLGLRPMRQAIALAETPPAALAPATASSGPSGLAGQEA